MIFCAMLSEIGSRFPSNPIQIFACLSVGALLTVILYRLYRLTISLNSNVIRIAPNHLHINDLDFHYKILKLNSDYLKDPEFYEKLGVPDALGTICDPHKHRILRRRVNPLFSQQAVNQMAGDIQATIKHACDMISDNFDAQSFFRAIAGDIVSAHYFGENMNLVDRPEYARNLWDGIDTMVRQMWYSIHIPYLASILVNMPIIVLKISFPGFAGLIEVCMRQAEKAIERNRTKSPSPENHNIATFFDLLMIPSPGQEPVHLSQNDMVNHGLNLVGAGVDTVSLTMTVALYHILSFPEIQRQVYCEAREATPFIRDKLDTQRVRTLPYLAAVIKEALRMYPPVPGRLPRIVPPQGKSYDGKFIPGGTVVSISPYTIQRDPVLFPEPNFFKPERWLADNTTELERAVIAFSSGSRMCPGIHLAYLEMHMTLAMLFSRFVLELESPLPMQELDWKDHFVIDLDHPVKVRVLADYWTGDKGRTGLPA
ncbi:Cytochrome P450 [Penicillium concentricum]|uniref:Cytochrome P450 n=1 Tax=Penicillium concentricum TaxID=293559 RepID=A0A9W9SWC2_9EURO|nr:Cytochrome P450 [Penicillium concentricum]KAJ5383743.1 Cytochrome P450 [Penicillium concentricum]